jgi:hypothetical protein
MMSAKVRVLCARGRRHAAPAAFLESDSRIRVAQAIDRQPVATAESAGIKLKILT